MPGEDGLGLGTLRWVKVKISSPTPNLRTLMHWSLDENFFRNGSPN
jgi:hypothetical protein